MEAAMSVPDAVKWLGDLHVKLPPQVATLVELNFAGTARKSKFLQLSRQGLRHDEKSNKKGIDDARKKINGMIEEVNENLDKEWVRCTSTISNNEDVLNETALDIALYRAQMTQASGDHLRAQGSITTLDTTATRLDDERTQAMAVCTEQIEQLESEIAIMVNDSIILQRILGMIDCPKSALIQCNDTNATFEKPELRTQMKKLKSDKVKKLIKGAVQEGFDSDENA